MCAKPALYPLNCVLSSFLTEFYFHGDGAQWAATGGHFMPTKSGSDIQPHLNSWSPVLYFLPTVPWPFCLLFCSMALVSQPLHKHPPMCKPELQPSAGPLSLGYFSSFSCSEQPVTRSCRETTAKAFRIPVSPEDISGSLGYKCQLKDS